jgi:AcrR family transcriptional regulator
VGDLATRNPREPSPQRRLPPAQRRQTLVDAASELFAARGYDYVTLDEVAARAGVTKVIVYRHFGSKKALYLTLLAAHRDELLSTLVSGMATERPLEDRVPAVADAWLAYVEAHPFAWAMLFRDVTGDPEIRAFHETMRNAARAAIVALLTAETSLQLDPDMVEPTAEVLRSAMTGLALWWRDSPQTERSTLVNTIIQTIWHGIASATERT